MIGGEMIWKAEKYRTELPDGAVAIIYERHDTKGTGTTASFFWEILSEEGLKIAESDKRQGLYEAMDEVADIVKDWTDS